MKSYSDYLSKIGRRVKLYRVSKGLKQDDLSALSGVSKRSISRLEQGETVQDANLFRVLIALGLGENIDLLVPDQTLVGDYVQKRVYRKETRPSDK